MKYRDIHDFPKPPALRAKYIGTANGPHSWLVYGNDLDTCGAITITQVRTKGTMFRAHRRGRYIGCRKHIEDAILLVLDTADVDTFLGKR